MGIALSLNSCLGSFSDTPPYSLLLALGDSGASGLQGRRLQLQIAGLGGSGLQIELTPGAGPLETLSPSASGDYVYSRQFDPLESFSVAILTQPSNPAHTCTITSAPAGAFGSGENEVIHVQVSCLIHAVLLQMNPEALPSGASPLLNNQPIRFVFNQAMTTGACASAGGIGPHTLSLATTSVANDTIVATPAGLWTTGTRSLSLSACTALAGVPMAVTPANVTYKVYDATAARFVRAGAAGTGLSAASPMADVATAVVQLNAVCPGTLPDCAVMVADGVYDVGAGGLSLTNSGVSLYGGYSADFSSRNISAFGARLEMAACGAAPGTPCSIITSGAGVGAPTIVQGFRIRGYRTAHTHTFGVRVLGGLSIAGNYIDGGNGTTESTAIAQDGVGTIIAGGNLAVGGMFEGGAFTPVSGQVFGIRNVPLAGAAFIIRGNVIVAGPGTGGNSIGLQLAQGSFGPIAGDVFNNIVITKSSSGGGDHGLMIAQVLPTYVILHNIISVEESSPAAWAIALQVNATPRIANNLLQTGAGGVCLKQASLTATPDILEASNLFGCSAFYQDVFGANDATLVALNAEPFSSGLDNLNLNPAFVNAAALNFRYQASSPCQLSQGASPVYAATVPADIDMITRTIAFSIGPYEYDGACTP
ncbi:MAG: hypothetical protein K1X75_00850 [Leptospirales bacterium]|nr:hypothetical protein [Leptospirales bacterium]